MAAHNQPQGNRRWEINEYIRAAPSICSDIPQFEIIFNKVIIASYNLDMLYIIVETVFSKTWIP
jgi:hypothetical protein